MPETNHISHYEQTSLPRGEFTLFKEDVERRLNDVKDQLDGIWGKLDRPSWLVTWIISILTTALGISVTLLMR